MIYLGVKTHNKTGLKYLFKTISKDPYKYKGSGIYWKSHIAIHGYDVTTQILLASESKEEIKDTGIFFSKLWNIVKSNEWANLTEEKGQGGAIFVRLKDGVKRSPEEIKKWKESAIRNGTLGKNNTEKMVATRKANGSYSKNNTPEAIAKANETKAKKKGMPGYYKQSPEARASRVGKKRGPYKKRT